MNKPPLRLLGVSGGVWRTARVAEQPELTLTSWSIRQLAGGDRHFVGWCEETREGRTSTKVVQFDPAALRGITDSGRVYQLSGKPGSHPDADYVWTRWLRVNGQSPDAWMDATESAVGSA